jgi:hypothetical protein
VAPQRYTVELIEQYLPGWQAYIPLVLACAFVAWFVTQMYKRLGNDYFKEKTAGKKPWWWRASLRCVAMLTGFGVAFGFEQSFINAIIGILAGASSSVIVYFILQKLEKKGIKGASSFTGTFSMTLPMDFDKDRLLEDVEKAKEEALKKKEAAKESEEEKPVEEKKDDET